MCGSLNDSGVDLIQSVHLAKIILQGVLKGSSRVCWIIKGYYLPKNGSTLLQVSV